MKEMAHRLVDSSLGSQSPDHRSDVILALLMPSTNISRRRLGRTYALSETSPSPEAAASPAVSRTGTESEPQPTAAHPGHHGPPRRGGVRCWCVRHSALACRIGMRRLLVLTSGAATLGFLVLMRLPASGSYSPVLAAVMLVGFGTAGIAFGAMVTASGGVPKEYGGVSSSTHRQTRGSRRRALPFTESAPVAPVSPGGGQLPGSVPSVRNRR
jgi:hypothetical protein